MRFFYSSWGGGLRGGSCASGMVVRFVAVAMPRGGVVLREWWCASLLLLCLGGGCASGMVAFSAGWYSWLGALLTIRLFGVSMGRDFFAVFTICSAHGALLAVHGQRFLHCSYHLFCPWSLVSCPWAEISSLLLPFVLPIMLFWLSMGRDFFTALTICSTHNALLAAMGRDFFTALTICSTHNALLAIHG